jgi:hypothetical protein
MRPPRIPHRIWLCAAPLLLAACTSILGNEFEILEEETEEVEDTLVCIDVASAALACGAPDAAACLCEGCVDDGICADSALGLFDDCVCSDCAADIGCVGFCNGDGECDPYDEGCDCVDCAAHPLCN